MKLVVTMMVRDESDIIGPVIENHLAQGVDHLIVTDNGSVDGTFEILESFGDALDLRQDPVQRKQQHAVVTAMARDAFTRYGADWVVNADADEFWVPRRSASTLKDSFSEIPKVLGSFTVPVVDMTGTPALRGSGLQRLIYRDTRSVERLNEVGLFAHSTPDSVHIGRDDIEVSQGNHSVNISSMGAVPSQVQIEVLHLPWRSWEQFERKVENAGKAYAANPDLLPSPNHHGMREFKRWTLQTLQALYVIRHPFGAELLSGLAEGTLERDTRIADRFASPVADQVFDECTLALARQYGPTFITLEQVEREKREATDMRNAELLRYIDDGKQRIDELLEDLRRATAREDEAREWYEASLDRRVANIVQAVKGPFRRRGK